MGVENALAATLGCPNLYPPNLAPDIKIRNLIFGTFVKATPYKISTITHAKSLSSYN